MPFLASAVLVGVGMYVRLSLGETPAFKTVQERKKTSRFPIVEVFTRYPRQTLLATLIVVPSGAFFYNTVTYSISFATTKRTNY